MTKIQLESGPSSSATHSLTQASHTLNRRYVNRPTNLAIEEAAARTETLASGSSTPSRLVNLRLHESDLAALNQAAEASVEPSIEAPAEPLVATMPETQVESPVRQISETFVTETFVAPLASPAISEPDEDTKALAMAIAADYAASSMGAARSSLTSELSAADPLSAAIYEAKNSSPIDDVAATASEAIAAIRTATDPSDVASQISSLRNFAADLRKSGDVPEMLELSNTIEKFLSIAEKSTGMSATTPKASHLGTATTVAKPRAAAIATTKPTTTIKKSPIAIKHPAKKPAMPATTLTEAAPKAPRVKPLRKVVATNRTHAVAPVRPAPKTISRAPRIADAKRSARPEPSTRVRRPGGVRRVIIAITCATACIAGILYFVATNIPDISVRVAAIQTGVEASYPAYIPREFSLQNISSADNKILLNFATTDNKTFTISEEKSAWDSTTLLRNYVEPTWGADYSTTHEQGITIYIHESSAAWVNGGVMYKISSNSSDVLTKKQLKNIVISMQ